MCQVWTSQHVTAQLGPVRCDAIGLPWASLFQAQPLGPLGLSQPAPWGALTPNDLREGGPWRRHLRQRLWLRMPHQWTASPISLDLFSRFILSMALWMSGILAWFSLNFTVRYFQILLDVFV